MDNCKDNGVKPCPVDRGKLLIGLECHRACNDINSCPHCTYDSPSHSIFYCTIRISKDAAAYIGWLEEKVEQLEAEKHKGAWLRRIIGCLRLPRRKAPRNDKSDSAEKSESVFGF